MKSNRDPSNRDPMSTDWRRFVEQLTENLPFMGKHKWETLMPDAAKIEQFVRNVVESSLSGIGEAASGAADGTAAHRRVQVFETHRSVFVRAKLPPKAELHRIRLFCSPTRLRLTGMDGKDSVTVQLPSVVTPGRSTATLRDGILEIRLPKSRKGGREQEIYF